MADINDEILVVNQSDENQIVFLRQKQTFSDDFNNFKYVSKQSFLNTCESLKKKIFYKNLLYARLPVLKWLFVEYNLKKDFIHDMIAGKLY
jgi:hypothetical protein